MSTSDVLIPSFSADVIAALPLWYKALAHHLADTGRAIIEDPSEKPKGD